MWPLFVGAGGGTRLCCIHITAFLPISQAGAAHDAQTIGCGVAFCAAPNQFGRRRGMDIGPVDDHRIDECLLARKTDDFILDQVEIPSKFLRSRLCVGAIWKFAVGVERETQPVGIADELVFVAVRHLVQCETRRIVVVAEKTIEGEFGAVFAVDFLQCL